MVYSKIRVCRLKKKKKDFERRQALRKGYENSMQILGIPVTKEMI